MDYMFYGCSTLKKLNLLNFDTSKVSSITRIFDGCNSLQELIISNFDTSNIKEMDWIFCNCKLLKKNKSFKF